MKGYSNEAAVMIEILRVQDKTNRSVVASSGNKILLYDMMRLLTDALPCSGHG